MHPVTIPSFFKPVLALGVAGLTYLADTVSPALSGLPEWINSLGLPLAFLLAVTYALVAINKGLRVSEEGRRADWATYSTKLENLLEKDHDSRERLIRATDQQTNHFMQLADQLKSRPCQKHTP